MTSDNYNDTLFQDGKVLSPLGGIQYPPEIGDDLSIRMPFCTVDLDVSWDPGSSGNSLLSFQSHSSL
jgi:hypothetical protein